MVVREPERKIVQLEQDNKELGDLLKELREAQINNGGANSVTSKLRNKLRRLEEAKASILVLAYFLKLQKMSHPIVSQLMQRTQAYMT
ncbi:hypothetical protein JHK85_028360 [Glycine max]|nr:hypothetical protein JHK85_028360 [Glycine max]